MKVNVKSTHPPMLATISPYQHPPMVGHHITWYSSNWNSTSCTPGKSSQWVASLPAFCIFALLNTTLHLWMFISLEPYFPDYLFSHQLMLQFGEWLINREKMERGKNVINVINLQTSDLIGGGLIGRASNLAAPNSPSQKTWKLRESLSGYFWSGERSLVAIGAGV